MLKYTFITKYDLPNCNFQGWGLRAIILTICTGNLFAHCNMRATSLVVWTANVKYWGGKHHFIRSSPQVRSFHLFQIKGGPFSTVRRGSTCVTLTGSNKSVGSGFLSKSTQIFLSQGLTSFLQREYFSVIWSTGLRIYPLLLVATL